MVYTAKEDIEKIWEFIVSNLEARNFGADILQKTWDLIEETYLKHSHPVFFYQLVITIFEKITLNIDLTDPLIHFCSNRIIAKNDSILYLFEQVIDAAIYHHIKSIRVMYDSLWKVDQRKVDSNKILYPINMQSICVLNKILFIHKLYLKTEIVKSKGIKLLMDNLCYTLSNPEFLAAFVIVLRSTWEIVECRDLIPLHQSFRAVYKIYGKAVISTNPDFAFVNKRNKIWKDRIELPATCGYRILETFAIREWLAWLHDTNICKLCDDEEIDVGHLSSKRHLYRLQVFLKTLANDRILRKIERCVVCPHCNEDRYHRKNMENSCFICNISFDCEFYWWWHLSTVSHIYQYINMIGNSTYKAAFLDQEVKIFLTPKIYRPSFINVDDVYRAFQYISTALPWQKHSDTSFETDIVALSRSFKESLESFFNLLAKVDSTEEIINYLHKCANENIKVDDLCHSAKSTVGPFHSLRECSPLIGEIESMLLEEDQKYNLDQKCANENALILNYYNEDELQIISCPLVEEPDVPESVLSELTELTEINELPELTEIHVGTDTYIFLNERLNAQGYYDLAATKSAFFHDISAYITRKQKRCENVAINANQVTKLEDNLELFYKGNFIPLEAQREIIEMCLSEIDLY